ncbi:MAG: DNA-binding Lrp family transcriptional regulator [Saprospiraceae bacterium]|jgi:DNA-binding Lrp family transcriptional regulator
MSYHADAIDRRIIQLLQEDGKMKIKEIAGVLKMTNTPIFERIKRLEKEGYIKGYSTLVDRKKLGFSLVVFCTVTLETHHKTNISQFVNDIEMLPEVVECYHIAGLFDYLLKVYVRDMIDYQDFITNKLASIPNIGRVQSSFVMTEVKNNNVLPLD